MIGAVILANEQPQATPAAAISNTAHAMSIGFMFSAAAFGLTLIGAWLLLSRQRPAPDALATPVEAF